MSPPELSRIRRNITVRDYVRTGNEFPLQEEGCINRLVEDGFIMHFSGVNGLRTYHTHLNIHGLLLYKQSLLYKTQDNIGKSVIRGYELLCRIFEVVECGAKFYNQIGYSGPLHFRMRLENLMGLPLLTADIEERSIVNYTKHSADPVIDVAQSIATYELKDAEQKAVLYFAERVGWAFDWPITDAFLNQFYGHMISH